MPLPPGLVDGSRLPEPIFTPATKAELGEHDENVDFDDGRGRGRRRTRPQSCAGSPWSVYARRRGDRRASAASSLADTKFEFGRRADGAIVLADEVLTPDSSRFWPADRWEPGRAQPSFDKQYVRDWLTSPACGWDRHSGEAPPPLPDDVVEETRAKYVEAYERLTGEAFA